MFAAGATVSTICECFNYLVAIISTEFVNRYSPLDCGRDSASNAGGACLDWVLAVRELVRR